MSQGSPVQGPTTYPTTVDLDAAPVRRWSPFVNWLLAIPHYFVLIALVIVWWFVMIISLFTVLFTKNIPDGLFRFAVMVLRYQWRVGSYVLFLRSAYPKFEFPSDPQDPGDDPAKLSVQKPAEYNRFLPLVKWLLAIPHFIILYFLGIAAAVVAFINIFVVLFTGAWSEGMRTFVVGYYRWQYRAYSYAYLLVDEYPPFSLE